MSVSMRNLSASVDTKPGSPGLFAVQWAFALLLLAALAAPARGQPGLCLVEAARKQIGVTQLYDSRYVKLAYPGGDVPPERGVCTDVIVRAYRQLGIDLQRLVHEDMRRDGSAYPKLWGLKRPDPNIDHRRVPNLARFFTQQGQSMPAGTEPDAYLPGDLVTWRLPAGIPHIGIVSDRRSETGTPLVIHNIGAGAVEDNILLAFTITGHYRYFPELSNAACKTARP
ncbi:MAG: DUF1287 domain-containing protein [Candidatus Competibacter sp.]